MTSLVKHSYEGATQEGLGGFLAGVGKGLVGTVTKPVIGVLDFAAETASALRDTSRRYYIMSLLYYFPLLTNITI